MKVALVYAYIVIHLGVCAGLVGCMLLRTTKDEGSGGIMGGPMQATARIEGMEDTLDRITRKLSVSFLVWSFAGGAVFSLLF